MQHGITTFVGETQAIGRDAAQRAAAAIRSAITKHGSATIVLATGTSQIAVLAAFVEAPGIDWRKVTTFHLDDYWGLARSHPASFYTYLQQRFVAPLRGASTFVPVLSGAANAHDDIARLNALITGRRIDVCFAGIGDNAHLAFNDPPADFETGAPFVFVTLDDGCRRQQVSQGWFPTLADVPPTGITMSVAQILQAECLIISAPGSRKAAAVKAALEGPVTPMVPASAVQGHGNCVVYLDVEAAVLLTRR